MSGLGEVWDPSADSETSYTGEAGDSKFSLQYYRNKAREYQAILNAVDETAQALFIAIDAGLDEDGSLQELLDAFDSKKTTFRLTAEAINLGAASINGVGGRFPELQIPGGLGAVPFILPAAAVAAIAVAATLIAWGISWISQTQQTLRQKQQLEAVQDPVAKAALAVAMQKTDAAAASANNSPLSSLANIIQWGAIGLLGFFAYQAFTAYQKR